jgi:serine phosphatase RsbU (regulator of sigma subunit)
MNAESEEWGTERLFELVKGCASSGPEALLSEIMEAVGRFRGSLPVADDMTLLAMSVE